MNSREMSKLDLNLSAEADHYATDYFGKMNYTPLRDMINTETTGSKLTLYNQKTPIHIELQSPDKDAVQKRYLEIRDEEEHDIELQS